MNFWKFGILESRSQQVQMCEIVPSLVYFLFVIQKCYVHTHAQELEARFPFLHFTGETAVM